MNKPLLTHDGKIVPKTLGHDYIPERVLDISCLWQHPYNTHRRLRVFATKGCECSYCDTKRGVYLIAARDYRGGLHVDLYTDTFELMTIDHFVPKSKGGSDDISNLFPACNKCNSKKKNKIIEMPVPKQERQFPFQGVNYNSINLNSLK